MTEIRTKDKLFLAVVVPIAALAAYWFLWRADAGRKVAELEREETRLVTEEDFPLEKSRAERDVKSAEEELAAEKAVPVPRLKVDGRKEAVAAERELGVLNVFRACGLKVMRVVSESGVAHRTARTADVLKATGLRPDPVRRVYALDGRYPEVVKALETLASERLAVIPESVSMEGASGGKWTLALWL